MTVYVDDMQAPLKVGIRRMKMCHMVADTAEELHAMARKIGVAARWHQRPGQPESHYDICLSKRALAIKFGAVEVTQRDVVALVKRKRAAARREAAGE